MEKTKKSMSADTKWQLVLALIFTAIGVLNVILLFIFEAVGIFEPRANWWLFGIGFFPCVWIPLILQKLFKFKWNFWVVLVFDIYVYCGITLGSMWNLYGSGWGFDKIVHVVGGMMWAVLPYQVFSGANSEKNHLSNVWLAVFLISFSMMAGGVWEIYEYLSDGLLGNNAQYSAGLVGRAALADTMQDLICDLCGAIIATAVILIMLHVKKKKKELAASEAQESEA